MKKDFLWFDEQLWSTLCAGPKRRMHTDSSEHPALMSERRPKSEDGSKGCPGRRGAQLVLIALFLTTTALGCNMMRGAGQDVQSAGSGIQRIVDHND